MSPQILRAGEWFVRSGIQESNGGVARYYRSDERRNVPISTEITGYAVSAFVYLHTITGEQRYLDAASSAASFLVSAQEPFSGCIPFEIDGKDIAYFFDSGITVRGLLCAWRALGDKEYLTAAASIGQSMICGGFDSGADFHPVINYDGMHPERRDPSRWSRDSGCYQLKAAMAWWDLAEATGDQAFRAAYARVLDSSLRTWTTFLPGHAERPRVMDRLHAFSYFLEGLLPRVGEVRCAIALCEGIRRTAAYLRDIAPEFARSDVYAQLLRLRLYADSLGALPLDQKAAAFEAAQLAEFQSTDAEPQLDGGYWFGRSRSQWLPYMNPVSTAFAMQALEMWRQHEEGGAIAPLHLLI